jgi:hypothetical protein
LKTILYRLSLVAVVILTFAGLAQAAIVSDFTGPFSPGNWASLSSHSDGSVVFAGDTSLTVYGPNANYWRSNWGYDFYGYQGIGITSPGNYEISFHWFYWSGGDTYVHDPAYYIANGWNNLYPGAPSYSNSGNGDITLTVHTGDQIGWVVASTDNYQGWYIGTDLHPYLTITNFKVTSVDSPVPEPSTLLLLGSGLLGLVGYGRRRFKK